MTQMLPPCTYGVIWSESGYAGVTRAAAPFPRIAVSEAGHVSMRAGQYGRSGQHLLCSLAADAACGTYRIAG